MEKRQNYVRILYVMAVTATNHMHDFAKNPNVGWKWFVGGGPKGEKFSEPFDRKSDCAEDAIAQNPEFAGRKWERDGKRGKLRIVLGWKDTEKLDIQEAKMSEESKDEMEKRAVVADDPKEKVASERAREELDEFHAQVRKLAGPMPSNKPNPDSKPRSEDE